jgi:hypothetical protein
VARSRVRQRFLRSLPLLMAALLFTFGCGKVVGVRTAESTANGPLSAQEMAQLWVDPGDVSTRDLFHGPGGPERMPRPGSRFHFAAKDTTGFSWGWDVVDEDGLQWSVKHGPEAQSEVVASRLLWAIGYHQLPTYYVESWQLVGGPEPGPGTPARFRPKLPSHRLAGTWSWYRNPYVDTEPYRGLLVLMRILNNWDLLDDNTAIVELGRPDQGASRWLIVKDLGASLGKTRIVPDSGTRNDVDDFEGQGFIKGVDRDGRVHFDDLGRRDRRLFNDVTVADVRWVCEKLKRLRPEQWRDAFRAARYEPQLADRFIRKLHEKVRVGLTLNGPEPRQARQARPARRERASSR